MTEPGRLSPDPRPRARQTVRMSLVIAPCRQLCEWSPTRATRPAGRLYACTGCGSQWLPGEPWTPRQADGSWPPGLRAELRRHDRAQDAASAPQDRVSPADGADTSDS